MAGDPNLRRIRVPQEMWEALHKAVQEADPELDRTKVIRQLIRWYIGETNELPRRPAARGAGVKPNMSS
jgi:metal-responsive CopG/Arc/MetJ family transcriptional regulator